MSRLDIYLVENGIYASRARAKRAIEEGLVSVNGRVVRKPAVEIFENDRVEAGADPVPFVSRGGFKLQGALEMYPVNLEGRVCLDVGASTGGFTQVLLQHGAKSVTAVDVGHCQLHEDLVHDSRVENLEGTDIRNLDTGKYGNYFDFAGIDVSFISLTYILPSVSGYLKSGAVCAALVKPQFELGKNALNKKGIVKQEKLLSQAVKKVTECGEICGFRILKTGESPVRGGDGNREFLVIMIKQ